MNKQEAIIETIELLLKQIINEEEINKKFITYLTYFDIALYAKQRKLKYSLNDIGRSQKIDILKSIIKHNEMKK